MLCQARQMHRRPTSTPSPGKPRQPGAHLRPQQGCVPGAEGPPSSVTRRRERRRGVPLASQRVAVVVVTAWRRVTLTACGRVRQRGVRVWEKKVCGS